MSRHFPTDWVLTLHRPGRPLLCCFSASSASSTSSVSCAPGSAPGSASSQCDQCLVLVMDQRGGLAEKLPKERLWRGASNTFLFLLFEYYCRVSTMEVLTSLSTPPPPPLPIPHLSPSSFFFLSLFSSSSGSVRMESHHQSSPSSSSNPSAVLPPEPADWSC